MGDADAHEVGRDGGRRGWWPVLRSWLLTFGLALALFLALTTIMGGPLAQGAPVHIAGHDAAGAAVDVAALGADKVVVYVFATWCSACKLTTPTVDNFAKRHPEIPVIALAGDEPETIRAALRAEPRAFRTIVDGMEVIQQLGVRAFPTTLVLDGAGTVLWNRQGVLLPLELDLRVR